MRVSKLHCLPQGLALLFVAATIALPPVVCAAPPPWAPAHGYRRKQEQHERDYAGYSGRRWSHDYGVVSGRCDRAAVGAAIGAATGGAIGSQVGQGNGRTVATIIGAVLGAVIGSNVGQQMDQADRACFGHALELARDNQSVTWVNSAAGITYYLTPTRDYTYGGKPCRDFVTRIRVNGRVESGRGSACRGRDGTWEMRRR